MDRHDSPQRRQQENEQLLIVLLGIIAVAAFPAILIGALFWIWAKPAFGRNWLARLGIALLVLGCAGGLYLLREDYTDLLAALQVVIRSAAWSDLEPLILRSWLVTLPAAPVLGGLVHAALPTSMKERLAR